jgi:hypothetical protein
LEPPISLRSADRVIIPKDTTGANPVVVARATGKEEVMSPADLELVRTIISGMGLISLVLILVKLWQRARWNKINATHTLVNSLPAYELEKYLWNAVHSSGGTPFKPIEKDVADKLFENSQHRLAIGTYLNRFEDFCAAVLEGYVDKRYARRVHSYCVHRTYADFKEYINILRDHTGYADAFIELETVAKMWAPHT